MENKRGRFIAFEGLDGSGKSTQLKLLAGKLIRMGIRVYETFEPTDSPIGSLIHQMMTGRIQGNHETIAALFVADRIDHLLNETNGIEKMIKSGITVLTDRYYFSSYAYHGVHLPLEWVIKANSLSAERLRPDVNIFLDVPPEECLRRLRRERQHLELYENPDSMRRVKEKYIEAFKLLRNEERVEILDTRQDPEVLSEDIWKVVGELFELGDRHESISGPSEDKRGSC